MKKSAATASVQARHEVIVQMHQQESPPMSVRQLCKLLGVNRRWYYQCRKQNKRAEADEKLRQTIEQIVLECAGYGYRRVTQALECAGWRVNHKRVLRVMREASLLCRQKRLCSLLPSKIARNRGQCTKNTLSSSSLPGRGISLGTSVPKIGDVCYENQEGANLCLMDRQADI